MLTLAEATSPQINSVFNIIQVILMALILPLLAYLFKALTNCIVNIATLNTKVENMQSDVSETKSDIKELKGQITAISNAPARSEHRT